MKRFYVKKRITRWSSFIVEADTEDEAYDLSYEVDLDNGFIEDSSGDMEEFTEISKDEFFDIPTFKRGEI